MNLHLSLTGQLQSCGGHPVHSTLSESIRRILSPLGIRTCFKLHNTLRRALIKLRDHICVQQKVGVIYRIPCKDCPKVNFGPPAEGAQASPDKQQSGTVSSSGANRTAVAWHWLGRWNSDGCRVAVPLEMYTESWHIQSETSAMNRDEGNRPPVYDQPIHCPHTSTSEPLHTLMHK